MRACSSLGWSRTQALNSRTASPKPPSGTGFGARQRHLSMMLSSLSVSLLFNFAISGAACLTYRKVYDIMLCSTSYKTLLCPSYSPELRQSFEKALRASASRLSVVGLGPRLSAGDLRAVSAFLSVSTHSGTSRARFIFSEGTWPK